jgi:hypothetical protein
VRCVVCRTRRGRSPGDPTETLVEVGDRVQIRDDGGSPAAGKYAGEQGRVTRIISGFDGIRLDIRVDGNKFDTVLEEGDLDTKEGELMSVGLFSGLQVQSELNRLLDELFEQGLELSFRKRT